MSNNGNCKWECVTPGNNGYCQMKIKYMIRIKLVLQEPLLKATVVAKVCLAMWWARFLLIPQASAISLR